MRLLQDLNGIHLARISVSFISAIYTICQKSLFLSRRSVLGSVGGDVKCVGGDVKCVGQCQSVSNLVLLFISFLFFVGRSRQPTVTPPGQRRHAEFAEDI
ncbi:Hypothetical_protein [Hexamita inflata]|uniref:Hypothetical_protein n=1 Tax=Hexamita inflata TaxID=28002 RepID=A0ABP1K2H8_9EUKA